jgi:predicted phage-related endonuclease
MTPIDELKGWLAIYREAKNAIAKAEEAAQMAREKIEDALGDDEVGTIDGEPVVRWTFVRSERFDQKKAKAILGDDAAACMVPTETRRFTLVEAGAEQ